MVGTILCIPRRFSRRAQDDIIILGEAIGETIERQLMVQLVKIQTVHVKIVDVCACEAGIYVGEYRYTERYLADIVQSK